MTRDGQHHHGTRNRSSDPGGNQILAHRGLDRGGLGFLVIAAVLLVFQWKVADLRNIVPTFRWTTDAQIASMTPRWNEALDTLRADAASKGRQKSLRSAMR